MQIQKSLINFEELKAAVISIAIKRRKKVPENNKQPKRQPEPRFVKSFDWEKP
jgi:hypothetical protein